MNWTEQCKKEAENLTQGTRQKILDELHAGRTIGQTREKFGVTLAAVCGVVDMNLVRNEYFSLNQQSS